MGPAYLFFGCRREDTDYIYREEMEGALTGDDAHLTNLHVAFSRDPKAGGRKVYVQDKLMTVGIRLSHTQHVFIRARLEA